MVAGGQSMPGTSFAGADVVDNYRFRPPYPAALYERLLAIAPRHAALLDLGCGPGTIARPLSHRFEKVVAVDPSRNMIDLARSLEDGRSPNIEWIESRAEELDRDPADFDLFVAANSIHWMEQDRIFSRLGPRASPDHRFVVISGDAPHRPPWEADWATFLVKWIPLATGDDYDPIGKGREWSTYKDYLDLLGTEELVSGTFSQSVEDFISCQLSRDAFASSRLGTQLTAFCQELRSILLPHSNQERLAFRTRTELVWGAIRR